MDRTLGRSGITVSAMGLGCWAIGGPFLLDGKADGWGGVDDDESVRAIRRAVDLGVTFFDTADVYGAGHSERVLGRALRGIRDRAVIATKFGYTFEESSREITGTDTSAAYIRQACAASLRRLGTDRIDLYQCRVWSIPVAAVDDLIGALDDLREDGLIRAYGWSTGGHRLCPAVRSALERQRYPTPHQRAHRCARDPRTMRRARSGQRWQQPARDGSPEWKVQRYVATSDRRRARKRA